MAANAPNDLLFVPYEAYYNVVLGNHNLNGLAYLGFVKNWIKVEKRAKKRPKMALFQAKVPDLPYSMGFFKDLGYFKHIFVTSPSKYTHRAINRAIICVVSTTRGGSSSI